MTKRWPYGQYSKVFGEAFAEEGVRIFNGDGNGTERFTALNIEIPSDNSGANSSHVTDQKFTYTVNGDGVVRSRDTLTTGHALVKTLLYSP